MVGLQHVSLFTGVGGFDLAAERTGITPAAMCEIDKQAQHVLTTHWPEVPLFTDVKEVTGDSLRGLGIDPTRTILTGGFPCQDVSVAGLRAGLAGARTGLFFEVVRILKEFQPAWFLLENVPGLLTSNNGRDMGTVLWSLQECGYDDMAYRILDAQYFGVPQRRRRVFIAGHLGSTNGWAGEVLALVKGSGWDSDEGDEAGQETTGTVTPSPDRVKPVSALTANGLGGGGPDDNMAQAGHLVLR